MSRHPGYFKFGDRRFIRIHLEPGWRVIREQVNKTNLLVACGGTHFIPKKLLVLACMVISDNQSSCRVDSGQCSLSRTFADSSRSGCIVNQAHLVYLFGLARWCRDDLPLLQSCCSSSLAPPRRDLCRGPVRRTGMASDLSLKSSVSR